MAVKKKKKKGIPEDLPSAVISASELSKTKRKAKIDIYIKEKTGKKKRKIRIPWLPASVEYESGGVVVATYDILNKGPIDVPTGRNLCKIKWESQLPGKYRTDDSLMRGKWKKPSHYHKILDKWAKKGTSLNVMMTGYPINKDVYISSYSAKAAGGFGDMEYSIEFTEDRDLTLNKKESKNKDKNPTELRPLPIENTYKVKKGDSLWKIAKRKLGSGKRWKEIYKLNKSIIEKTAKKKGHKSSNNGKRLYPGTKLKLPNK